MMEKKPKSGNNVPQTPPRSCGTVIPQRDFHSRNRNTPLFIEVSAQNYSWVCAHGRTRSYTRVICPELARVAARNVAALIVTHPNKTKRSKENYETM